MTAKDALVLFFKAENERNWDVYQQFLHEEIVWQLFEKDTRMICGIQDYMQTIKKAYENPDAHFICQDMQVSKDGNRIVANLVNEFGIRSQYFKSDRTCKAVQYQRGGFAERSAVKMRRRLRKRG